MHHSCSVCSWWNADTFTQLWLCRRPPRLVRGKGDIAEVFLLPFGKSAVHQLRVWRKTRTIIACCRKTFSEPDESDDSHVLSQPVHVAEMPCLRSSARWGGCSQVPEAPMPPWYYSEQADTFSCDEDTSGGGIWYSKHHLYTFSLQILGKLMNP